MLREDDVLGINKKHKTIPFILQNDKQEKYKSIFVA